MGWEMLLIDTFSVALVPRKVDHLLRQHPFLAGSLHLPDL